MCFGNFFLKNSFSLATPQGPGIYYVYTHEHQLPGMTSKGINLFQPDFKHCYDGIYIIELEIFILYYANVLNANWFISADRSMDISMNAELIWNYESCMSW